MRVVVPTETRRDERRVALSPDATTRLVASGFEVVVQTDAGAAAGFSNAAYEEAGARLAGDLAALLAEADVVLKVQPPAMGGDGRHEAALIREGATLIGFLKPYESPELLRILVERRITSFAMELVPRITRAQKMDALSSQATAAGYRAVLLAATAVHKFFPMLMTAAGTVPPARVLVIGAGVAGLQAIATARRLGAVVQAFDIRPAVKEQVESLGATFVGMVHEEAEGAGGYAKEVDEDFKRREHELLHRLVQEADVVISTAQVPGKKAPVLITPVMVAAMRPGSVIVDVAAEAGGNCGVSRPGETIDHDGVLVLAPLDLAAGVPFHASQMYARNVVALLTDLVGDGALVVDPDDEIVRGCCVTHDGAVIHETVRSLAAASS